MSIGEPRPVGDFSIYIIDISAPPFILRLRPPAILRLRLLYLSNDKTFNHQHSIGIYTSYILSHSHKSPELTNHIHDNGD